MSNKLSTFKGVQVAVYQIAQLSDVSGYVPTNDSDSGDIGSNIGLGQNLYQYADPEDGAIIFQGPESIDDIAVGDYLIPPTGGYRYYSFTREADFEGTFNIEGLGELIRGAVEKTSAYTVVITTDSGKTFTNGATDGVVFTLPGIAVGNTITFVNTAEDGAADLTISPNAADGITYAGSSTDDKDLILTKATSRKGDYVTLASLDGVVAWQVVASRGIWAKEA